MAKLRERVQAGQECAVEILNYRKDGRRSGTHPSVSPVWDDAGRLTHFVGVQADVTERRRLEEQLRQAQKMEAVGPAGRRGGPRLQQPAHRHQRVQRHAARTTPPGAADRRPERAGRDPQSAGRAGRPGLTRQLLAFSRKQVLAPRVLDLNAVVADIARRCSAG